MVSNIGTVSYSKKVQTRSLEGEKNGWLMQLYEEGDKTLLYLTTIASRSFKGYHLHRVRTANYVCLKGEARIELYRPGSIEMEYHVLIPGMRLHIPIEVATGLLNEGDEEVWLINFPDPAYDPSLEDEQVEYSKEELLAGVVK